MKIRNSFISNSSSSSFVVAFPYKPKTVEETLDIMFPEDKEGIVIGYSSWMHNREVAEFVFEDIKKMSKNKQRTTFSSKDRNSLCKALEWDLYTIIRVGIYYDDDYIYDSIDKQRVTAEYFYSQINSSIVDLIEIEDLEYDSLLKEYCKEMYNLSIEFNELSRTEYIENISKEKDKDLLYDKEEEILKKYKDELISMIVSSIVKKYKKNYLFVVEYGDEDGLVGSILEHGNIFKSVPYMLISNH